MKTKTLLLLLSIMTFQVISAQTKQGNTLSADIFADAPFRMIKTDQSGELKGISVHCMIFDGDEIGASVELIGIDIAIKNASESNFGETLCFDTLTNAEFDELIIQRSENDTEMDIQSFNESEYCKSADHSIDFTAETAMFTDITYVSIDQNIWYFTFMIPPEVLAGYEDIIDIKVYFHLDWSDDDESYLRVFRYNEAMPSQSAWYRGDTHTHTIFTQNLAEVGEVLEATKLAGKEIGLDWQIITDHSCDYDNYGNGLSQNWNRLGNEVYSLNAEDSSYQLIRGVEMSVKNSKDKIVHALTFPSASSIESLNFYGDGGGDASSTDISLSQLLDSIHTNNGIVYAAHPFAEGDELPSAVNGGIWNVNDSDFLSNGSPYPYEGNVICNDLESSSDIFSNNSNQLFKSGLYGFQIWNLDTRLVNTDNDNFYDAWNVTGDPDKSEFMPLSEAENLNLDNRFMQGFEVYKHLLKTGLQAKNGNPNTQQWKTFMCAGSDAHGSFNFSNTDMIVGVSGEVEINALGRISTLAYCPNGMGEQGEHVLEALETGKTIISDGPIISLNLTNGSGDTIYIGSDNIIQQSELENYYLNYAISTSDEFGDVVWASLFVGTEDEEIEYTLTPNPGEGSILMQPMLNAIFSNNIPENNYFYLRAAVETNKEFGEDAEIYKRESEQYHAYTNPIWIMQKVPNSIAEEGKNVNNQIFYAKESVIVRFPQDILSNKISLLDSKGKLLDSFQTQQNKVQISKKKYASGIYLLQIGNKSGKNTYKIAL